MFSKLFIKFKNLSDGAKSGIIFSIAILFTKGLSVITVPIFTRIMSSDQIGVVNLYNSWFSIISVIATLSLTSGGYQLALKEFGDDKDAYESSILTITTLMGLLILGIFCVEPNFWSNLLGLPISLCILLCIGFIVTPAQDFWMSRQRFDYKYKLSGLISIATAIVASLISIYVVITMSSNGIADTATGRLWGNYIIVYGTALCFFVYIFAKGRRFFEKKYWKYSLSISLPLIGHAVAKQILDVSDRQMISKMVDNSAVGIYSTLYTVSSISLIAWNAINAAFVPYLFKNIDDKSRYNDIRQVSAALLIMYVLIALLFTYMAPEIVRILAPDEYYESIYIMPPIAMGVSLTAVSNLYSNVLVYYKKTKVIMIASVTAAISNIILNYIFIKLYGYQAAAYTTLFSFIILTVIEAVIATKTYKVVTGNNKMIYLNGTIFTVCIIALIVIMLALLLYKLTVIRYILCGFLLLASTMLTKKYLVRIKS